MSGIDLCVVRSRNLAGEVVVRLGVVLLDEYLDFLAGRCRANTVLAAAYDLKVFFTVAAKPVQLIADAVLGAVKYCRVIAIVTSSSPRKPLGSV